MKRKIERMLDIACIIHASYIAITTPSEGVLGDFSSNPRD
jgi:hypothetical protein